MLVGVPKESYPGERRVAIIPDIVPLLAKAGFSVVIEAGAGDAAGCPDTAYTEKGATVASRGDVFADATIIAQVRAAGANPDAGTADLDHFRAEQVLVAMCDPLTDAAAVKAVGERGVLAFALELLPRITRAQSMDVLSSMATMAGYKAVLLAAEALPRIFPMLMTAAGTVAPAHVFIVGAGVAGLQAIASAKRLGAVVHAYDVRPAVKEQCESLGAKFVEMDLETGESEDAGGYAKAMDEEFYRRQRELMTRVVAENHVVITTAAIPGKKAPVLISEDMVAGMMPGSVIVDLAAERGGNCAVTEPGETVVRHGVTILGPLNLPSTVPYHASQMYSRNIMAFLKHLAPEGELKMDMEDEITRDTLLTRGGDVVNPRVRELLGLPAADAAPTSERSEA
jgi:NAD(P) transhydrogenase subunit alpha